jgi:hypothetical protein
LANTVYDGSRLGSLMPQSTDKKVKIRPDLCGFGTAAVNLLTIILIGKICR